MRPILFWMLLPVLLGVVWVGEPAQGQEARTAVEMAEAQPIDLTGPDDTGSLPSAYELSWKPVVRMFAWLAFLVVIIFALLHVLRRILPQARLASNSTRVVKVLARSQLTPKQAIYIVQVGKTLMLLGVTAERITNLGKITEEEEIEMIMEQVGAQAAEADFRKAFAEARGGYGYEGTMGRVLGRAKGELDRLVGKVAAWKAGRSPES